MVQIIEKKEDCGADRFIEFRVYRSPADPDLILGEWQCPESVPVEPKGAIAIAGKPGTPVKTELLRVLDYADQHGISFVWVNDPNGLFPPS